MARMTNKRRADQLLALMKDNNYNPLDELIKLTKHSSMDARTRIKVAIELMQYVYPKQKAVELDQNQGQPVTFNIDLTGKRDAVLEEVLNG